MEASQPARPAPLVEPLLPGGPPPPLHPILRCTGVAASGRPGLGTGRQPPVAARRLFVPAPPSLTATALWSPGEEPSLALSA